MKITCSSPKTRISEFTSSPSTLSKFLCASLNSAGNLITSTDDENDDELELIFNFKNKNKEATAPHNQDQQHKNRDLVRRNLDTATTSLHPSIDPVHVRLEFSSSSSSTFFSIFVNKNLISLKKYPQYTICGKCYILSSSHQQEENSQEEDDQLLVPPTIQEVSQILFENTPQKIIKAVYKNRTHDTNNNSKKQQQTTSRGDDDNEPLPQEPKPIATASNNKQLWTEACEMTRLLYPMKGNGEVILEPNGVLLGDVVIVGRCSKFFYFGIKNDEELQERIAVIGWAPHGGLMTMFHPEGEEENAEQEMFSTLFPSKKYSPKELVSFDLLENSSPSSLPRPMHEISWISSSSKDNNNMMMVTAQVVTYRILLTKQDAKFTHFHQNNNNNTNTTKSTQEEEGSNTDWIQKFQFEDSHILTISKTQQGKSDEDSSSSSSLLTVSSAKQTVHQLHKYTTIQGKGRGGMSTIMSAAAKQLLKKMCDPKFTFTFVDKRDLNKERRNIDSLFLDTIGTGLVAGGGISNTPSSVRVLLNNNSAEKKNNSGSEYHLQNSDETQQVEFKQQLHQYNNNNSDETTTTTKNNNSKANIERARRILAAFANTKGGLLFVGVNDDGDLVGIKDDNNNSQKEEILPRSTGFIPSMITNSVSHIKLKFPQEQQQQQVQNQQSGAGVIKPTAALDWWKKKPGAPAAPSSVVAPTANTATTNQQQQQQENKAVHVMAVMKGAAPFYSTPGPAAPPVRGQASTLLLNVTCLAERLMKELKSKVFSETSNNNNEEQQHHDDSRRREREE